MIQYSSFGAFVINIDQTLLFSFISQKHAVNYLLNLSGQNDISSEKMNLVMGLNVPQRIEYMQKNLRLNIEFEHAEKIYSKIIIEAKEKFLDSVYKGSKILINNIKKHNISIVLLTRAPQIETKYNIITLEKEIGNHFYDQLIELETFENSSHIIPNHYLMEDVLSKLGNVNKIAYIGNSTSDFQLVMNSREKIDKTFFYIHVGNTTNYQNLENPLKHNVDLVCNNVNDLIKKHLE